MFLSDSFFNWCARLDFWQLIVVCIFIAIGGIVLIFWGVYEFDKHCMQPDRDIMFPYHDVEKKSTKEEER